jgi:hypothetical protein
MNNRRHFTRHTFPSPFHFTMEDSSENVVYAATTDICWKGVGITTPLALNDGQVLRVRKHMLPYNCKKALVCWVKKIGYTYRIGLKILV